jgi:hypothetical protein
MRRDLAPLLFDDEELSHLRQHRDPVAPTASSASAKAKTADRVTVDGFTVHCFDTLPRELATRCSNTCRIPADPTGPTFERLTELTPRHAHAFQLLGL